MDIPGEPAPWLHPHPSKQGSRSYIRAGPPASAASVLNAFGFCLGTLPPATFGACDPGRRIDARLLTFRARAADQAHAASTPDTAWPIHGHPPGSSRGMKQDPRFRCHLNLFDASTAHARPGLPGRALLERLPGPHLTRSKPRLFPDRSPRRSSANAASGRFSACPRRPTLEGQQASISRTAPPMKDASYTTPPSAFVTHASQVLPDCPTAHARASRAYGLGLPRAARPAINRTGDRGLSRFSHAEIPYMHRFFDRAGLPGDSR
jgi:hypothetical protein